MEDQSKNMKEGWNRRWAAKLHHELTLAEFVGPFPVGPEGYRRGLANMIAEAAAKVAKEASGEYPEIVNPHRSDLRFFGATERGAVYAVDAITGEGVGFINSGALGVDPQRRGQGVPEELYWLISEGRRKGQPAVRHTMDYSLGGFKARIRGHALILNRIEDKSLIPPEVMKDYVMVDGKITLARPYAPDDHNMFWGVNYYKHAVEPADDGPAPGA